MTRITNKKDYEVLKKMCEEENMVWVAKDEDGEVCCYDKKPCKSYDTWDVLIIGDISEIINLKDDSFVSWKDEEPTKIVELLKEYEIENGNKCDNIKPSHYNIHEFECFEEMQMIYGTEALITFCKLNVHKYRYRFSAKNKEEDLQKANEYLKKIKELQQTYLQYK